jgi:hypothetical protein
MQPMTVVERCAVAGDVELGQFPASKLLAVRVAAEP